LARRRYAGQYLNEERDPLVSVVIATWNRGQLLAERTIPSVLAQTYSNFEIVVVGDHCEDDTEERLNAIGDPRIKFTNLPERGKYPQHPDRRWRVAGTDPANRCIDLARGTWITYLDDDDVYTPDHIEVLLRFAQQQNLEFAYAACDREILPGEWVTIRDTPHRRGFDVYKDRSAWGNGVAHSTWLYRSYLRFFKYDKLAWAYDSYGDQSLIMRMGRAGVRAKYLDRVVASMPLRPGDVILSQSRFRSAEEIEAERETIRARWNAIKDV
jgi:glycosyltransferase involved in cell wall biosynthesis